MDTSGQGNGTGLFVGHAVQANNACAQRAAYNARPVRFPGRNRVVSNVVRGFLRCNKEPDTVICLPASTVSGTGTSRARRAVGRSAFIVPQVWAA